MRRIEVLTAGGIRMPVWVAPPARIRPSTRLVIVVHGMLRNADEYIASWVGWARESDHLVAAPEFTRRDWPGARSFNLGNVLEGPRGDERPADPSRWAFTAIDTVRARLLTLYRLHDPRFDLWGHSAGAQFVHRLLLFQPRTPVRTAIAAGAGWFTHPDLGVRFPYGLAHPRLGFRAADVTAFLAAPLVVMRGCLDRERDPHLRTTRGADAQGRDRFARAAAMVKGGIDADPSCRWRLVNVPGAGHDARQMAPAAQGLLTSLRAPP